MPPPRGPNSRLGVNVASRLAANAVKEARCRPTHSPARETKKESEGLVFLLRSLARLVQKNVGHKTAHTRTPLCSPQRDPQRGSAFCVAPGDIDPDPKPTHTPCFTSSPPAATMSAISSSGHTQKSQAHGANVSLMTGGGGSGALDDDALADARATSLASAAL